MPRALKFTLIGCGGLLVLLVFVAGCVALVFLGYQYIDPQIAPSETEKGTDNQPAPSKPTKQEEKKTGNTEKGDTQAVTVRVTGTPGTTFSGVYTVGSSTQVVNGTVPQDFDTQVDTTRSSANIVTITMYKRSMGSDELKVQLLVDGEVKKEQSTTANFGVVSITQMPNEV